MMKIMTKTFLLENSSDFSSWRDYVSDIESPFSLRATHASGRAIDAQIGVYLKTLFVTGGKTIALRSSALQPLDIYNYRKKDPQFLAMENIVLKLRSESIVDQLEKEALEGQEIKRYDKFGNVISSHKQYETSIRLAMLKRHSEGAYDDKSEIDIKSGGNRVGAVIVPAGIPAEEWEMKYGDKAKGTYRPVIEGVVETS